MNRSITSTVWSSADGELSHASAEDRRTGTGQRLHRPADLLPVHPDAERQRRSVDHTGLPLALGHRLVLVFPGFRRPETVRPPAVAAAIPAQQLLLEAGGTGPAIRDRRPDREAQRPAATRAGRPGHRGADRADGEFLEWFLDNVPIEPIWLCPLRLRDQRAAGRCIRSGADHTYVNIGFWSSVPVGRERRAGPTG